MVKHCCVNQAPVVGRIPLRVNLGLAVWLLSLSPLAGQESAPDVPSKPPVLIKLITDFESGKLVSDVEEIQEITTTVFDTAGSHQQVLGERCVLWVRNAHVDNKFFFERFYQDKYIGRGARLEIDREQLGVGEHVIQPGQHKFTLSAEGQLASDDPSIRIDGNSILLRLHKVTIHAVDAAKAGPSEFRLVSANLGLLSMDGSCRIDPEHLPDPAITFDPQSPPEAGKPVPPLTNVLSHQADFYPLSVWLPANEIGQGYVLYPSWQAFRLLTDGHVDVTTSQAPRVPGIEVDAATIVIPYRAFSGQINSRTGLTAGVGAVRLQKKMNFGATLAATKFVGSHERPPEDFYLLVDNDISQHSQKFFLADNSTADKDAIRLLALEWSKPVYTRAAEAVVRLQLLQTPGKELKHPRAQMSSSVYRPSDPSWRDWQPVEVIGWKNGPSAGDLRFQVPDSDHGFVVFRVEVIDADDVVGTTPLWGEINACIVDHNQTGSSSFVSSHGRTAFVAGEDIDLELVLRSQQDRPAGERTVVLTHPDGKEESLKFADPGNAWFAQSVRLPGVRTANLAPANYQLSVRDLPPGVHSIAFVIELIGRQKPSLFEVVKTSMGKPLPELEPSHFQGKPLDIDRAMQTLSELGYTRVDLMSGSNNHHLRAETWREDLAALDPRLPPPASVYTPSPREQILNASVRNQLELSHVWLSYGDFYLPRYIDSYIHASERWMAREMQAMRYSPAFDGLMLYWEMYAVPAVGMVPGHQKYFSRVRADLAEQKFGESPAKLEQAFNRYLQRPPDQRDPQVLQRYLAYQDWQQLGWTDYIERVVKVGKALAPSARFGTYLRTWGFHGSNDDLYNGYAPDLFKSLDIIAHVHYADNMTSWVSIPMLAQLLRTGQDKCLYVNMPLMHEFRTEWDGQYQRHMAFALLAQGANGIAQYGLPHSFNDGPNPGNAVGRETTARLNRDILRPLGEIIDRTRDGYRQIGIVSTKRQHALNQTKQLPVGCQTEGIWIACWRLGYPAVFLREDSIQEPLDDFAVLFVPGVRFDDELDDAVVRRLKDAIAAGKKVVVESDSALNLPGLTKLSDWSLTNYFVGEAYFATWEDDELNKVFEKSQATVNYLGPKLREWGVEPAATGRFKVGPSWRDGGDIDYLVMANFEDPEYGHTVRQQMAKPTVMPLTVPGHHGRVAYDLLAQKELDALSATSDQIPDGTTVALDMRNIQGALIAFLPERIGKLQARRAVSSSPSRLRLSATLVGESGRPLDAVFPVKITLQTGSHTRTFYRVLGRKLFAEFDLPSQAQAGNHRIEMRDAIGGQTVSFEVPYQAPQGPTLELVASDSPQVPHPREVQNFMTQAHSVVIVPSQAISGVSELARKLANRLKSKGIAARVADEEHAYHYPLGDPKSEDPLGDGFHTWHSGQELIGPATIVDEPVILMGGRNSSLLLDQLADHGFLSPPAAGGPGLAMRPSIQVAVKGLHYAYDTLCLVANDAHGMQRNIDSLFKEMSEPTPVAEAHYAPEQLAESTRVAPDTPATAGLGNNELVRDLQFDAAGNLYAITWGHGKNLYSFTPDGSLRFSRFLPEMGTNRLSVHDDRLYAYTSAGARLYQLSLDNRPLAQARLNMDPGPAIHCDNYSLSTIDFEYVAGRKLLVHNLGDHMRVLDEQFQIVAQWQGEAYFDKDVADKTLYRKLHGFTLSPDQTQIAQLETSSYFTKHGYEDREVFDTHLVIRDLAGKLLYERKNLDNSFEVHSRLLWPTGAPGPLVLVPEVEPKTEGRRWSFTADLQLLSDVHIDLGPYSLGGQRRLIRDGRMLAFYNGLDREQCRIGPLAVMPTFVELSPDGRWLAMLDEYGLLSIYDTQDGKLRQRLNVSELGQVLRFSPNSQRLAVGGYRGGVHVLDLDGKSLWLARLGEFNDILGQELPLYDLTFPDFTERLWPTSHEEPGELDKLVRLGANRLVNGEGEGSDGWQGPQVAYCPIGYESSRSLKVGEQLVGQEVKEFLGTHSTWVLEFFYRTADAGGRPELLAGIRTESDEPDSVAARFQADDTWRLNRVVIKNGAHCKRLVVGFSARAGEVLVDRVQLRQIRFPSVNHLLYEPLYHVKPVVLENPLFSEKYDPVGNLREQTPNRVLIPGISGPLNLVESAFLQNGRLNEISSNWYIQPFSRESPYLTISLGLREPRWVSTVALYFNEHEPKNSTPHFDIYAVDLETGKERLVTSVRHNGQRFRLVKFPPIKTPLIKLTLVNSIARLRTLTEVELYGPLSGREGTPSFVDPDGQNTYMGDFTRVDKRSKSLAPKYLPPMVKGASGEDEINWFAPLAEILASEDRFYVARTLGKNTAYALAAPMTELYWGRAGGLGYTPFGAFYGGLLLRCGNDGKLYCLNPETGTELWSVQLGQRLFGCPVAIGEDVFVTSDTGKLTQLDLSSGTIMKEVEISGAVFGSMATDGQRLLFITDDGALQCYGVADLQPLWKTAVAPFTDSTPAIDQGVVYLADQQGKAMAIDVQSGQSRWTAELKDEFSRCPVVGPDKILFGCRGGTLAAIDRASGAVTWSKPVESRFEYEPVLLGDRALFFRRGAAMLVRIADGTETPFQYADSSPADPLPQTLNLLEDPVVPISYYKGRFFFIHRPAETAHGTMFVNMPWGLYGGNYTLLSPVPPETK